MLVITKALWEIFAEFEIPKIIQSENGKEFVNQAIKQLCSLYKIDKRLITPFSLMFGRRFIDPTRSDITPAIFNEENQEAWEAHHKKLVDLIYPAINEKAEVKRKKIRKVIQNLER